MRKDNKQRNISGIQLDAPRLVGQKPAFASGFILNLILILLGAFGTVLCSVSAFALPVFPITVLLSTLLFVIVLAVIFHLNRVRHLILMSLVFLYAAASYLHRAELVQGYFITANQITETYAKHSGYSLPLYDIAVKSAQYQQLCTMFILSVVFFNVYFLCWAIIVRKNFLLTFAVTFPYLLGSLLFTITPDFYAVLMLAACWGTLLFVRLSNGETQEFEKQRKGYIAKSPAVRASSGLLALAAMLLCFSLILALFPKQNYKPYGPVQVLRNKVTDTLNRISLFGSNALAENLGKVDLSNSGAVQFTGKTMLQVQTSEDNPLYLKGFVGSVYDGLSWQPLADAAYSDINQKLKIMNVQNMSFKFTTLISLQNQSQLNPFGIRVKNIGANKQCIYAPYNLTTTPADITGVKFINDSVIQADSLFGIGEYNLYAYGLTGQKITSSPAGVFISAAEKDLITRSARQKYLRAMQLYLTNQNQFTELNHRNLANYYKSTVPDSLMDILTGNKRSFVQAEQDYRLFLYDRYTQLPSNIKSKVQALLKEKGMLTSYGSVDQMVGRVKEYLKQTCTYTLSPGKTPEGRDFTDYFLFENHKGYCVHFATAEAVMLRAMGVPARYAEGYIVTKDDYDSAIGGWANIKDNRAHAWVEVYYPGLGWQPFETTPGFSVAENLIQDTNPQDVPHTGSEAQSSAASSASSQSVSSSAESKSESAPQSTASSETTLPSTQADDLRTAAVPIFAVIALIAALAAAAAIKRRIVLIRRSKRFRLKNAGRAAICIYAYLTELTKFGVVIPDELTEIALKARFSQHEINAEELGALAAFAEKTAQEIYSSLPKWKRLQFKYLNNLI